MKTIYPCSLHELYLTTVIQSNEKLCLLVLPIHFLLFLLVYFDFAVAIVVPTPLLGNIFNKYHWNLVTIVFMLVSDIKFVMSKFSILTRKMRHNPRQSDNNSLSSISLPKYFVVN